MFAVKENFLSNDILNMKITDLKLEWKDKNVLIVGAGSTGLSCAEFLNKHNIFFTIIDSREDLNYINKNIDIVCGYFQEKYFSQADILIVSPGVSIKHPFIQDAINQGKEVIGDVELFCRLTDKPIIAITGSNGKSTVTTLVSEILNASNITAKPGGNIGIPCLDLITTDSETDCYVLELSSFQLETTFSLKAYASIILNISEDHMDRYDSYSDYRDAKEKVLHNAENIIFNSDDDVISGISLDYDANTITFSLVNQKADFYIKQHDGNEVIYHNNIIIADISNIKLIGLHNKLNILAALSLCSVFDTDLKQTQNVINDFSGLEHRSQMVSTYKDLVWINDSKATNIGATSAALAGLSEHAVHLILGGQSKAQDFNDLVPALTTNVKNIYVYGEDADLIIDAIVNKIETNIVRVETLEQSINLVASTAVKDDVILFSPACASFDQFDNYMHRGESFIDSVKRLEC